MMDRVFIADKELVNRSFSEIFATDWVEKKFKDSLVVYSLKENPKSLDELKESVNSYRQAWENTLYKDVETSLEEYSNILETFNYIGNVINTSGTIGFTGSVISPSPLFSGLSTFIDNFEGEVIIWNDDITGDPHILGLGEKINFFTVNNYL